MTEMSIFHCIWRLNEIIFRQSGCSRNKSYLVECTVFIIWLVHNLEILVCSVNCTMALNIYPQEHILINFYAPVNTNFINCLILPRLSVCCRWGMGAGVVVFACLLYAKQILFKFWKFSCVLMLQIE